MLSNMNLKRPCAVSSLTVLWVFFIVTHVHAGSPAIQAIPLVENGGYIVTRNGVEILSYNRDKAFVPASTIKIATAFAALELLGPDYRFKTEFYLRGADQLCIKGYGDPYLISEYIAEIAKSLKEAGLRQVNTIIIDDTFFDTGAPADGSTNSPNPYDAVNAALSVNFNAVPLIKYDSGMVASPEPQTPLLPVARDIAAYLEPGLHRVNVSSFTAEDARITRHRYAAELFAALLRRQDISVGTGFQGDRVRPSDTLLYTYHSKLTLAEMIRGCLEFSNNFIANQIFLTTGAAQFAPPATWTKSQQTVRALLISKTDIKPPGFRITEGSGLSPQNRLTPAAAIKLLDAFKPYAALLSRSRGVLLKSGTLQRAYNYAGYFETAGRLDPFVLLLNQRTNSRDDLLKRFAEIYSQAAGNSP